MTKEKIGSLKLTYNHLINIKLWLMYKVKTDNASIPLLLHGLQSRTRNRMLTLIEPFIGEFETERQKLIKLYARKDKKTKEPLLKEGTKTYDIVNVDKFNDEFSALTIQEVIIDILPSTIETIKGIRDIFKTFDREFDAEQGQLFDEVSEKFETIK